MATPLSEHLTNLAISARNAEDAVAAESNEAREKIEARREQSRAAVSVAVEKVNEDIQSAGDTVSRHWDNLKAKIAADNAAIKADVAEWKHGREIKRTERYAQELEQEASFAIDYAIVAVEQAKLAVLDALIGRVGAEEVRAS